MSTEIVTLTDANPLKELQRSDGTWSAREVQKSGNVHSTWQRWEQAIGRGKKLVRDIFGETEVSRNFSGAAKVYRDGTRGPMSDDIYLQPLGLFAACQQSDLPELDMWFVFAGLQAAGYGIAPEAQSSKSERTPEQKLYRAKRDRTASMVKAVSGGGPVADQVQILAWNLLATDAPLSDVTFEFVKKWLSDQGTEATGPALRKIYEAISQADSRIVSLEMHQRTLQAQAKGIPAPPVSRPVQKGMSTDQLARHFADRDK